MVAIAPFRALRYNLDLVGSLRQIVAPPYDVISPEEQDRLYEASPHNIVRLILGKQYPADSPTDNRYTRAKQTFDQWRNQRILIQDNAPAIYLYEHTFRWSAQPLRRLGFVALLEFAGSVPDRVLLHEATFEQPKADRRQLLDAVRANLSPLFCIFSDQRHTIADLLNQWCQTTPPLSTFTVPGPTEVGQDEVVRLWAIPDPNTIHELKQHLSPVSVLVADGHHRFEVALASRHRFGAVMSSFFWLEDPAVVMRPIHRALCLTNVSPETWGSRLQALCELVPTSSFEQVTRWLTTSERQGQFGYYAQGRFYQASLRQEVLAEWLLHPSVPLALAGLDVTILHELLIPKLTGPSLGTNHLLRYTPEPSQAIALVDSGQADCAWLLRQIPLEQVFALASQRFTLPQKSTYFYPKILSGLFINAFDPVR